MSCPNRRRHGPTHQWNNPKLHALLEDVLPHNRFFDDFELGYEWPGNDRRTLLLNARPLEQKEGEKGSGPPRCGSTGDSPVRFPIRWARIFTGI